MDALWFEDCSGYRRKTQMSSPTTEQATSAESPSPVAAVEPTNDASPSADASPSPTPDQPELPVATEPAAAAGNTRRSSSDTEEPHTPPDDFVRVVKAEQHADKAALLAPIWAAEDLSYEEMNISEAKRKSSEREQVAKHLQRWKAWQRAVEVATCVNEVTLLAVQVRWLCQ